MQQPKPQSMLQVSRVGLSFQLFRQQLACGIALALPVEYINLHHQGRQIGWVKL
ncbi:hypothetical protein D3C71_2201860 [compost metagenome]